MVSQNYVIDDQKDTLSRQTSNLNITYRNSPSTFQPPLGASCCSTFTGNNIHQGRFQYLGDRPLEITHSLKGYGNRGSSSDVIFRSTTNSSNWWNVNKKGWKYFRWVSIFSAILLLLGLIVYFLVIATDERNATTGHEFIEIVQAPDLTRSTITEDKSEEELIDQNKSSNNHTTNITESINSSEDKFDLQRKESQDIRNKSNRNGLTHHTDLNDEIMMTSDRDITNKFTGGHRNYQVTNGHSRLPVHPTIPSIILKKTKELLGDPFAPVNETESACFSTRLDICKGVLPYDLTTLPSVPGINRLADLDAALPYFEMILQSGCSKRARQYICSVLEPACQPMGNRILPPCRKACKAVAEECSDFMLATLDLSKVFHCNLYPDLDDSNECVNFAKGDKCLDDELRCVDGSCIPARWECDNVPDCPLASDELNCTSCHTEEFRCDREKKCIPLKWQCDGNKDCADGSDEINCTPLGASFSAQPHTSPCPVGELRCVDGRCITIQQLCDNIHDCSDGADEGNCGGPTTIIP